MFSDSNLSVNEEIENIVMPEYPSEINISDNQSFVSNIDKTNDFSYVLDFTDNLYLDSFCESLKGQHFVDKSLHDTIWKFQNLQSEEKRSRLNFSKTQLVLDVMDDIFDNSNSKLYKTVRDKCSKKLKFCNLIKNKVDLSQLINIEKSSNQYFLSSDEKNMVHSGFKDPFTNKLNNLKAEYKEIADILNSQSHPLTIPGTILTEEKVLVLDLIDKVSESIVHCNEDQIKIINAINSMHSLWEDKFQEFNEKEMNCLEKKLKLVELKMKNLNYMIENAMVEEDENRSEAVEILYKELIRMVDQIRFSLEKLKTRKREYENLKGTKFDEILQEYINLRENYKQKCWAIQAIKKNDN